MKRFHPQVADEVEEAALWYDRQKPGLGSEFVEQVQRTLAQVEATPFRFPKLYKDVRRAITQRFPYGVYFCPLEENLVLILAVQHLSRDPARWQRRR